MSDDGYVCLVRAEVSILVNLMRGLKFSNDTILRASARDCPRSNQPTCPPFVDEVGNHDGAVEVGGTSYVSAIVAS